MRFVKGLANSILTYVPNVIHICPNKIISLTNAYSYVCMTYLTAPQHLCINAWSYHIDVYGIAKREKKRYPNLTCEGQTTNKHER